MFYQVTDPAHHYDTLSLCSGNINEFCLVSSLLIITYNIHVAELVQITVSVMLTPAA